MIVADGGRRPGGLFPGLAAQMKAVKPISPMPLYILAHCRCIDVWSCAIDNLHFIPYHTLPKPTYISRYISIFL